jgi:hypothetical protein
MIAETTVTFLSIYTSIQDVLSYTGNNQTVFPNIQNGVFNWI